MIVGHHRATDVRSVKSITNDYRTRKGYDGEVEYATYLTKVFSPWKHKFVRVGGTERNKKLLSGDVVLDPRTDPKSLCFLRDYFLECKKHASPDLWAIMKKSESDARSYGKHGAIAYVIKQGQGHKRDGELVVMTPETFKRLAIWLQGYIHDEP